MKAKARRSQSRPFLAGVCPVRQHSYWTVICLTAMSCGGGAMAQTTNTPAVTANSGSPTNAPVAAVSSGGSTNVTKLENVTVIGKLDQARSQILPDLGATAYTMDK